MVAGADDPSVTVIIPAYNRAGYIEAAVTSVLRQTYSNVRVIVVDDASIDGTFETVQRLTDLDPRVQGMRHTQRRGAQVARNTGIEASRGEWIAFLDSDDTYLPDSIELRMRAAIACDAEVVHSACDAIGPDGRLMRYPVPPLQGDVLRSLLAAPGPVFPSLLVRRHVLDEIGLLDPMIKSFQEWDTSIRLAELAKFAFVAEPTFIYDMRTGGAISRSHRAAADGYQQIVIKHGLAMLRECGRTVLADHYHYIARQRALAGDTRHAVRDLATANRFWPFAVRKTLGTIVLGLWRIGATPD